MGSPSGWGIPIAGMTRFAPTVVAMEVMVQSWAVGIPALSNSLVSAAPQRVPVPHVETRRTASTLASFSSPAIATPMLCELARLVAKPVVV